MSMSLARSSVSKKKTAAKTVAKKSIVAKSASPKNKPSRPSAGLPAVGDKAPLFTLINQDGQSIALEAFRGHTVLLYFYPKDDTPGCTTQACDFQSMLPKFKKKKTVILGISLDSQKSHQKFRAKYALDFDLLVDEEKQVSSLYGVYQKKKFMGREFMGIVRSTFVIDPKGIITHVVSPVSVTGHAAMILDLLE